jgi:hypothetical protein
MSVANASATMAYFGKDTVEAAIAAYFAKYGVNDKTRDRLMKMAVKHEEAFLDMVCQFVDKEMVN